MHSDESDSELLFPRLVQAQRDGREVDPDLWIEAYEQEFLLLPRAHQIILVGQICEVAQGREAWDVLEGFARQGLALFDSAPTDDPPELFFYNQFLTALAITANSRGDLDGALAQLETVAGVDPQQAYLAYWRGSIFCDLKDRFDEAVSLMERCIDACPFGEFAHDDFEQINVLFDACFGALHEKRITDSSLRSRIITAWGKFSTAWKRYDGRNPLLAQRLKNNKIVSDQKKCFIATACCAGTHDYWIDELQGFREQYLRPTAPGRIFIGMYERISPNFARFVARSGTLKSVVRSLVVYPAYLVARSFRMRKARQ